MKGRTIYPMITLLTLLIIAGNSAAQSTTNNTDATRKLFGWGHTTPPPPGATAPTSPARATPSTSPQEQTAVVKSALRDGETLFVELEASGKTFWAATVTPEPLQPETRVRYAADKIVRIDHYESQTLQRTFERLYFIDSLVSVDQTQ